MRIAILSDIHGNRWALEAILEDIQKRGLKHIVNLGDSLYGPLDSAGTADLLLQLSIPTIRGNEDRILIPSLGEPPVSTTLDYVRSQLKEEHLQWLQSLEMTAVAFGDLFLCHGTPERDDEYLLHTVIDMGTVPRSEENVQSMLSEVEQEIILCGHDHVPGSLRLPDGRLVVNPGSVGLQAYTDDIPLPHHLETGIPHARYCILSKAESGWTVIAVALPYDWETAAHIALKNGREDWYGWLMTGRASIPAG